MRVAINDVTSDNWSAGGPFTEMLLRALRAADGGALDPVLLTAGATDRFNGLARAVRIAPQARLARHIWRRTPLPVAKDGVEAYCDRHRVDALLLATSLRPGRCRYRRIAWIPDFQHLHLPQYFSPQERAARDQFYGRMARYADAVLLSSHTALEDYRRSFPSYAGKGHVAPFPSLYTFVDPEPIAEDVARIYHLPRRYVLVANQYWTHKNHAVVIEAIARLKEQGCSIPAVFTGQPSDYRDARNAPTSRLLQLIATKGLAGQVVPLGLVPRAHLTALMRHACAVIQPSEFEGWSTSVQDALALGKPLICSEIPIHREQAPGALGFFPPHDAPALAALLADAWPALRPEIDREAEQAGRARQRSLAATYGRTILDLCCA